MTTAKAVSESLAEALGRSFASVESYGLVLRRFGWWGEAKRGRGARAMTSREAAKLLLSILSAGPTDLAGPEGSGFFLTYANLALLPALRDDPIAEAIRDELGLPREALFLDYLNAIICLFRDGRATDLIYHEPNPDGFAPKWQWDGPDLDIRVKGPFPMASISFMFSPHMVDRLVAKGMPRRTLEGHKVLAFVHQLYGWAADASEREGPAASEPYFNAIESVMEHSSRGVRFERAIGGREVDAVSRVLAKPEDAE